MITANQIAREYFDSVNKEMVLILGAFNDMGYTDEYHNLLGTEIADTEFISFFTKKKMTIFVSRKKDDQWNKCYEQAWHIIVFAMIDEADKVIFHLDSLQFVDYVNDGYIRYAENVASFQELNYIIQSGQLHKCVFVNDLQIVQLSTEQIEFVNRIIKKDN